MYRSLASFASDIAFVQDFKAYFGLGFWTMVDMIN